jgi:ABC-type multidrug transport system fused ATPase/permease subunit
MQIDAKPEHKLVTLGQTSLLTRHPRGLVAQNGAAQSGGAPETHLRAALLFVGVATLQQAASVSVAYLGANVGWRATNDLRKHLADHCLRLDMSFHNAHTPGEMIERVDGDANGLSNFFSLLALQFLGNSLLLLGMLASKLKARTTDMREGSFTVGDFALFVY